MSANTVQKSSELRESALRQRVHAGDYPLTLGHALRLTADRIPDRVAVRTVNDETSWTWRQLRLRVDELARGLYGLGIRDGDCVGLMLSNRPEFHVADLAAVIAGATPFSVYSSYTPEQIAFVMADSGASVLITEQSALDRVLEARKSLPKLRHVIVVDGSPSAETISVTDVVAAGADCDFDVDAAIDRLTPDRVLTLIYTSGTTGDPKGVEITHANVAAAALACEGRVTWPDDARVISWLPAAHIAERVCHHYLPVVFGAQITCCPDPRLVGQYLPMVRPTWFFAVPRVWEKMHAALETTLADLPGDAGAAARAAVQAGLRKVRLEQAGDPVPDDLASAVAAADEPVFAGMRANLGLDAVYSAMVGAAPSSPETLEFFHAIGIPLSGAWGMSETTGTGCTNPLGRIKIGTVGTAAPGYELTLADDGEILVRGPGVMRGYRNQPTLTAETIVGGWLRTGDIGTFDADGYLRIVDRKKELIINAMGKNMSPAAIEAKLKAGSPLIGQACCIGDARPYNTALIVLDADATPAWAARNGIAIGGLADLARDDRVRAAVQEGVDAANARMARVEQIKKFTIVAGDWLPAGDELTPTMKLKRKPIAEKYAEVIENMYR